MQFSNTVASTRECEEWPDQLEMHMVHIDCQTRRSPTGKFIVTNIKGWFLFVRTS